LRGADADASTLRVGFGSSTLGPAFLRAELEGRRVRGAWLGEASEAQSPAYDLRVLAYPAQSSDDPRCVAMCDELQVGAPQLDSAAVLYAPAWRHGTAFVEVAARQPGRAAHTAYRLLSKAGVKAVVTSPRTAFLTNELLRAYLRPQLGFLRAGGAPNELAATLLDVGFTRLPGDWLRSWDLERVAALVEEDSADTLRALPTAADACEAPPSEPLRAAVLLSLLACARRSLAEHVAPHPSVVDVAARELLDFPIGKTSLCRHLTVACARRLLEGAAASSLAATSDLESVKEYIDHGREFYR
jgi:hypothetical protein